MLEKEEVCETGGCDEIGEAGERAAEKAGIVELPFAVVISAFPDANQGGRNRTGLAYRKWEPASPRRPLHGPPITGLPCCGHKKTARERRLYPPINPERQSQAAEYATTVAL